MNKTEFRELECMYARFPTSDAVDGSRSCRTFVALHCSRKKQLVHKNLPSKDNVSKNIGSPDRIPVSTHDFLLVLAKKVENFFST
jgi:hypothetical protein